MLVRLGLAAAFVCAVAVLAVSASGFGRAAAFGNSMSCYRTLYFDRDAAEPAKAVFIGSSRIRRGLDPDRFAEAMGWRPDAALNLGHPGDSPALDAALVAELAKREAGAALELVVVELAPRSPALAARERKAARAGKSAHDLTLTSGVAEEMFYLASTWGEMTSRIWAASDGAALGVWDVARAASARIKRQMTFLVTRRTVREVFRPDPRIDAERANGCMRRDWYEDEPPEGVQARLIADYRAAFGPDGEGWRDPAPERYLTAPELAFTRAGLADLAELGRETGVAVVGLYVPGIATPHPDPELIERVEAAFGVPLLVPDPALRARLEDGFYADNVHLNASGRAILTDWLLERLRDTGRAGG